MCELCDPSRHPPGPARRDDPAEDGPDPGRPAGLWPHLSGVRGHLSVHPLRPVPTGPGGRAARRPADEGLRLVLRGALTRQVLEWSDEVGPAVLARVRVVCTADLTHLDDAGRALLVRLVRVASRQEQRLHVPAPSPVATAVLGRLGLLAAVDTGPDPWWPRDDGARGDGPVTP